MKRPAHGATSRPGPSRPASGYGRSVGCPGPGALGAAVVSPAREALDPSSFVERVGVAELEVEVPATP